MWLGQYFASRPLWTVGAFLGACVASLASAAATTGIRVEVREQLTVTVPIRRRNALFVGALALGVATATYGVLLMPF